MTQPAYKHIQDYILNKIEDKTYRSGEQIPTEMALAEQFSVSRMTVNKAIVELSQRKVLTRIAGKGTFVTKKTAELPLLQVMDLAEEVKLRGATHQAKVLEHREQVIYGETAIKLGVASGSVAGYCEILHFEDDTPLLWERRYVNIAHLTDFMIQDFQVITPTRYLLDSYPLTEIEHTVEATACPTEAAALLELSLNSPCLQIVRRTWSADILVSHALLVSSGSRYKMHSRSQVL